MSQNLQHIIAAKEGAEADLLSRSGVTAVDVGYKYVNGVRTDEVAIRVMVEKKTAKVSAKEKVPDTIDGVKTDVIERTYFLHAVPGNRKKLTDITLQADTGSYNPVKGGIGIGPCRSVGGYVFVGTLGAIVKDNASGNPLLLSNFHVMCIDNGWHAGDTMAQPGLVDGGTCPANVVGTLQRAALTGLVDCAVSSLSGRGYSCEIVDIGRVNGTAAASLGEAVRKRGRTTGLTYGFVESVSLSVNIDYGDGIGVRTLSNQISIRPDTAHNAAFGDHGDSGSAVVDGSVNVVGLHFAGSSDGHGIANVIANVLSALNVSMCTGITKAPIKDIKDGHKELKIEKIESKDIKHEKTEHKDIKNEKFEHKEAKLEKIETKDHKVEKLERKEIKEIEKPIFDNGPGKGPVETGPVNPGLPGPVIGAGMAKVTDKQLKEVQKPEIKEIKEKPETKDVKDHKSETKENKDQHDSKIHKDAKDFKDGPDNKHHKDQKDGKDNPDNKAHKDHKDLKDHKEHKEAKDGLKPEVKDHKIELKEQFEKPPVTETIDPKAISDNPGFPTNPGFPGEGGFDQRMSQLEATVAGLSTFITGDLRPDLSTGALNNESDGCKGGC